MKLSFTIDTTYRTMTADLVHIEDEKERLEALRLARLYAGLLFPHVAFLEFLQPVGESAIETTAKTDAA